MVVRFERHSHFIERGGKGLFLIGSHMPSLMYPKELSELSLKMINDSH